MSKYAEQRYLPYTPEQLFDLVIDIERYPEFLPWCVGARVRQRSAEAITADLAIGFKVYRERFTSHVVLKQPNQIDVQYTDGPFRYLRNQWKFEAKNGGCTVDFFVDFELKSKLLQSLIEVVFTEAVRRMVSAFETRAGKIYGTGKGQLRAQRTPAQTA